VTQWLDDRAIDRLMDPVQYLGVSGEFIDRVLTARD
jgi:hypothetical protein